LQFLDAEGRIIDTEPIYWSGFRGGAGKASGLATDPGPPPLGRFTFTVWEAADGFGKKF